MYYLSGWRMQAGSSPRVHRTSRSVAERWHHSPGPGEARAPFLAGTLGPDPVLGEGPQHRYKLINARSETVTSKPSFREAFESRRCLIPADGFYEWKRTEKAKQPFHFGMADDSLFAFAGLWDRWKEASGQAVESCSILTTTPNALLADVHDRMPVILNPEHYDLWLDPGFRRAETLKEMLNPFDATLMKRHPVSTRVNFVKNDDPECAAALQAVNPAGAT
jgi:putative SOS response-associated peptidase YedK